MRNPSALTVETYGTPDSIQWYKVDPETSNLIELEGETSAGADVRAYGAGNYVCGVSGKSLEPSVSGTTSTIYTSPYAYTLPEPAFIGLLFVLGALLKRRS